MIWVKLTYFVHILVQSLIIVLIGLIATLPKHDVLVLTDFTKLELISIIAVIGFIWQFVMAIILFVVPPFAYKNQMLDLTILLAYPILTLYTFLVVGLPLPLFAQSPAFWTMGILAIIYFFVSILDVTTPEHYRKNSFRRTAH